MQTISKQKNRADYQLPLLSTTFAVFTPWITFQLCHAHLGEALEGRMHKAYLEPESSPVWDQFSLPIQSYNYVNFQTNAIHRTKLANKNLLKWISSSCPPEILPNCTVSWMTRNMVFGLVIVTARELQPNATAPENLDHGKLQQKKTSPDFVNWRFSSYFPLSLLAPNGVAISFGSIFTSADMAWKRPLYACPVRAVNL